MVTIKGPLKISGGFDSRKMAELLLGDSKKLKLPFKATGWRSERNSDMVDGGKLLTPDSKKKVEKKVERKLNEEKPKKKSGLFKRK